MCVADVLAFQVTCFFDTKLIDFLKVFTTEDALCIITRMSRTRLRSLAPAQDEVQLFERRR